jgi:hypothetical protein
MLVTDVSKYVELSLMMVCHLPSPGACHLAIPAACFWNTAST